MQTQIISSNTDTRRAAEVKEAVMASARRKGICLDGFKQMHSLDIPGLVDYYLRNPDWCLERGFPDLPTLRAHSGVLAEAGVFIDRKFRGELLNDRPAYIFHNCRGTIRVGLNVESAIIPMLYVASGSRLSILGVGEVTPRREADRTRVPVYTFGPNDVSARDSRYVKFLRYHTPLLP